MPRFKDNLTISLYPSGRNDRNIDDSDEETTPIVEAMTSGRAKETERAMSQDRYTHVVPALDTEDGRPPVIVLREDVFVSALESYPG
jgi:hypothetical protein